MQLQIVDWIQKCAKYVWYITDRWVFFKVDTSLLVLANHKYMY
jgi:hypothetical protein